MGKAKTLIVEFEYFDLDYRSEFTATHETSFTTRQAATTRLHFFEDEVDKDVGLAESVRDLRKTYLGYAVLRPQRHGAVGRSLVPLSFADSDHGDYESRVRTAVTEYNELFGVSLRATGVPFMQQDGHLLRCAHVSAWICHYTAVLRGFVPRRASAALHAAEDETGAYGRQYPSHGLSRDMLARILRKVDLPPEILDQDSLENNRASVEWFDRDSFRKDFNRLFPGVEPLFELTASQVKALSQANREALGEWREVMLREAFTSSVCRYLNSGFPVILGDDQREHTRVICGYKRVAGQAQGFSDVDAFLLQDDQGEPFTVVSVKDLMHDLSHFGLSLIVPLPRGIWMSGEVAERMGASLFGRWILENGTDWAPSGQSDDDVPGQLGKIYKSLLASFKGGGAKFAVRSFVTTGSDFKASFAKRTGGSSASVHLAYTRLPKFVWIVELVDRDRRTHGTSAVLASIAIDASQVTEPAVSADLSYYNSILWAHVPGWAISGWSEEGPTWVESDPIPQEDGESTFYYDSGRWRHSKLVDWESSVAHAHSSKGAQAT